MTDPQTPDVAAERPPYLLAGLVALGALVLYALTLAPTTQFWDAPEYITAAHALGIPHPPGSPLFVILAHAWGLLPLGVDYARRINLFAATTSAVAAGLWFLIGERWLRPIVSAAGRRRLVAGAGAVVGATAFTVWNQSVVNEKVYTLSVLTIALVLWLAVRWADQPVSTRRDHHLVLIVYLLALTSTNHLMGVLAAPAVLVYVLLTQPRALSRPRFLVAAALVVVVGLSVNLFIPIRANLDPYLNQGEATTWPALKAVLARDQFGKPSVFDNPMFPPGPDNPGHSLVLYGQQLLNYVQYFTWQFGRDWLPGIGRAFAVLFGALGLLGARRHWRADRRAAVAMTTLILTLTVALVFYLNFKWGYSQAFGGPGLEHEVRERDYFFIASFAAWGVWVGMGIATLMEWIDEALAARAATPAPASLWAPSALVLMLALVPLVGNRLTAPRSGETLARDYAHDVLQSVDPYALVVTAGDNDTFPLWYAQEVDGVRRDVSVLVLSLANTGWYVRQLQRRAPPTFDAGAAPAHALDEPFLSRRPRGHAPGLYPARAAGHRPPRAHRGGARSQQARAPVPDAGRPGGAADHQGSAGEATHLLLHLHGQLRGPARPLSLSGRRGSGASRGAPARRGGRRCVERGRARVRGRAAVRRAAVRGVSRRGDRRPAATARLGGRAVAEQPAGIRLRIRHHRPGVARD